MKDTVIWDKVIDVIGNNDIISVTFSWKGYVIPIPSFKNDKGKNQINNIYGSSAYSVISIIMKCKLLIFKVESTDNYKWLLMIKTLIIVEMII